MAMSNDDATAPQWLERPLQGNLQHYSRSEALDGLGARARNFVAELDELSIRSSGREALYFRMPQQPGFPRGDLVVLIDGGARLIAVQLDENTEVVVVFGADDATGCEFGEWSDDADRFADAIRYIERLLANGPGGPALRID
jgi:hypothetical protein